MNDILVVCPILINQDFSKSKQDTQMQRLCDQRKTQLVYCRAEATSAYWDGHWKCLDIASALASPRNHLISSVTKRYLAPKSWIVEGGCGPAITVATLIRDGYNTIGIDFAQKTLRTVHSLVPSLPLVAGDVFRLPFPEQSVDGYWSLGVIEHFYYGYGPILLEARRILKTGGILFLTFPYMCPVRKLKAKLGCYPPLPTSFDPKHEGFYQFALNASLVKKTLKQMGFQIVHTSPFDAVKGLKDEFSILTSPLGRLYSSQTFCSRLGRLILNRLFARVTSHSILVVAKKEVF